MIHVGADLFVRECLNPRDWSHEYAVFDGNGNLKTGLDDVPYNLAGPLCFAGDILAREIGLPPVEAGDYLAIRDTGSYTFSMWSRYNSRQTPAILGYRNGGKRFEVIRRRETPEETIRFWE
jgi:diaminopimelate decarboxylase